MTASNTQECIREFVGLRVVGVLFNTFPLRRNDLNAGTKTLVFEDGRGLTFSANGSFWAEPPDEVRRGLQQTQTKLDAVKQDIEHALELAGAVG